MTFIGQFPVRLDPKNRVFMPAGFRHSLSDAGVSELVVRKDYFENCLVIYPLTVWQAELEKVRSRLNRFDGAQQMLYRKLVSEAQMVQIDASGRILLPKILLDKAGIGQEALFVGMQDTIEIWAQDTAQAAADQNFMTEDDFRKGLESCMKD